MLKQFDQDPDYILHEHKVLQKWKEENTYDTLIKQNINMTQFRFCDGPPFVSADTLHFGHILVSYLKDSILRYKYMKGFNVLNKIGYDCHGLPIEMAMNKKLGIRTTEDVLTLGIGNYNRGCKELINSYSGGWNCIFERIGRMVNLKDTYMTMNCEFMESTWNVFKGLWEKGLIYKGFEVMPYSIGCGTALSNFEADSLYKVIETESVFVLFPLKSDLRLNFVAWTTTPWTLVSHVALCVNPEASYVKLTDNKGVGYIVAEKCMKECKIRFSKCEKFCFGRDLIGIEYVAPFDYVGRGKYAVIGGDFVRVDKIKKGSRKKKEKTDELESDECIGTGIVHLAPQHGVDDLRACLEEKLIDLQGVEKITLVDKDGKFSSVVTEYAGIVVTDCDHKIIEDLQLRGLILRVYKYRHRYPHCWRTEAPLIYKAVPGFFVAVTKLREELLLNNSKVKWIPENIGAKKFHNWLDSCKDWAISRTRFFGTPVPVWMSADGTEMECIGSIPELVERAGLLTTPLDIHREFIDHLVLKSKTTGALLYNVKSTLDCWFESGSVPLAQYHYPFENTEKIDGQEYLTDFVAEGLDQTRGWFYTLMVLSTALFNKPAFKTVICSGLILDENGQKMAKKHGNFQDPKIILDKYGSDILRLYLLSSVAVKAEPLLFNESQILMMKQRIIPYINGVKFFIEHMMNYIKQHGGALKEDFVTHFKKSENLTDKWIVSRSNELLELVTEKFEAYAIDSVVKLCVDFIDDLTNWYIKFNRDRLKGLAGHDEWLMSLSTCLNVLHLYSSLTAPIMPFLSDYVYDHLKQLLPAGTIRTSIHLCQYPSNGVRDLSIEMKFLRLQHFSKCVRKLRSMSAKFTSVRIPIKNVTVIHHDMGFIEDIKSFEDFISDELNCLNFEYRNVNEFIRYTIVVNKRVMGNRYRELAGVLKEKLALVDARVLKSFVERNVDTVEVVVEGVKYELGRDEFDVIPEFNNDHFGPDSLSLSDNGLTVVIDTVYDLETHNLFQLRLLMCFVQNMRKDYMLRPWDKIQLYIISDNPSIVALVEAAKDKIMERLRTTIVILDSEKEILSDYIGMKKFEWNLDNNDNIVSISVAIAVDIKVPDNVVQCV
ncbi:MAG: isoleucyl-tRNA synthetase [Hyperionvirus sp.]|uniref:isoleucine--tRNA ligase n=1 Tax=Hyperionvirus sp. TaxID=2487770 RepID=A0A3G5A8G0_9VIRU|nr:MAG: isoleucyl-tRNA synthetase [Hyperionvirus sp.]